MPNIYYHQYLAEYEGRGLLPSSPTTPSDPLSTRGPRTVQAVDGETKPRPLQWRSEGHVLWQLLYQKIRGRPRPFHTLETRPPLNHSRFVVVIRCVNSY